MKRGNRFRTTKDILVPKGTSVIFVSYQKHEAYRQAQALVRVDADKLYQWNMDFDDACSRADREDRMSRRHQGMVLVGCGGGHHADCHAAGVPVSEPATPGPNPPPDRVGQIGGIVNIVKGLSLTNVLIIALLVVIAIPTYIAYRFLNDDSLLNKFTSFYEELSVQNVSCTLRIASQRGAHPYYAISTGFAFQGSDRYNIGVILSHRPDDGELASYCETLNLIVDFMRRPDAKSPTFPNSEDPLIWQYAPPEGAP